MSIEDLQILLIFPKDSPESDNYEKALKKLKESLVLSELKTVLYKFPDVFKENSITTYLKEADLRRLPNFFQDKIDLNLLAILYEWSNSRSLTQKTLDLLKSYLSGLNLNDPKNFNNHHVISAAYILFYYYYGKNGCNLNKNFDSLNDEQLNCLNKHIGMYLSNGASDDDEKMIFPELKVSCRVIKQMLHAFNRGSSFDARDLCRNFNINLDISLLIRLCIDGIRQNEDEKGEYLFLVIGNSGCGKSTTVNYLAGIEYKPVYGKKFYLKQADETVIAPARVGHGHMSETLFPSIITKDHYSFCDLPGFHDTGPEPYKSCAALGLPLAVHFAKDQAIRGLMVVIEWSAMEQTRLLHLQEIMNTINSVLSNEEGSNVTSDLPILFLVTKPELPSAKMYYESDDDYDRHCRADRLAETVMSKIAGLIENEKRGLTPPDDKIRKNLSDQHKELIGCVEILSKLEIFHPQQTSYWQNMFTRIYKNEMIDQVLLAKEKKNFIEKLKIIEGIPDSSVLIMSQFIDQVLNNLRNNKSDINDMINQKRLDLEQKIKTVLLELDRIKERQKIFEKSQNLIAFMEKITDDDIMIIRGFELKDDYNNIWPDHKEKLFDRLKKLCEAKNRPKPIQINGEDDRYKEIQFWTISKLNYLIETLRELRELEEDIDYLSKSACHTIERIKANKNELKAALCRSHEDNNELMTSTEAAIANLEELKKTHEDKTTNLRKENQEKIDKIRKNPPVEFGSIVYSDHASRFARMLGIQTVFEYSFPGVYREELSHNIYDWFFGNNKCIEHILPLEYVELSTLTTVIDNEKKLVFKTPLSNKYQMRCSKNLNSKSIKLDNVECEEDKDFPSIKTVKSKGRNTSSTGAFTIKDGTNLSQGRLRIEYKSNQSEHRLAGIRCFVRPEHFPYFKRIISDCEGKIKMCEQSEAAVNNIVSEINREIEEKKQFLDNIHRGLYDKQKGEIILSSLKKLGFNLEEFLDVMSMYSDTEQGKKYLIEDVLWIGEKSNLNRVKTLLKRYDEIKNHIGESVRFPSRAALTNFIYGRTDDQESMLEIDGDLSRLHLYTEFKFEEIDFQQIYRLLKLSLTTGLTFTILNMLVISLKSMTGDEWSLLDELEKTTKDMDKKIETYKNRKAQFKKEKWVANVVEIVVEALNYKYLIQYQHYASMKSYLEKSAAKVEEKIERRQTERLDEEKQELEEEEDEEEDEKDEKIEENNTPQEVHEPKENDQVNENINDELVPKPQVEPKNTPVELASGKTTSNRTSVLQITGPLDAHLLQGHLKPKKPKSKPSTPKVLAINNSDTGYIHDLNVSVSNKRRNSKPFKKEYQALALEIKEKFTHLRNATRASEEIGEILTDKIQAPPPLSSRPELKPKSNNVEPKIQIQPQITSNIPEPSIKNGSRYKILCIDGGGIRALIPALVLAQLEKHTKKPIHQMFDMICGTSTGAIIAAMLSIQPVKTAQEVVDFLLDKFNDSFNPNQKIKKLYSNEALKKLLVKHFGERRLTDSLVDLVITASTEAKEAHVFYSRSAQANTNDNLKTVDVLLATTAAPSFFMPYKIEEKNCTFLDGGVVANSPTSIALKWSKQENNVFILSLGTGSVPEAEKNRIFGNQIKDNSDFTDNEIRTRFPNPENYMRLQPSLTDYKIIIGFDQINRMGELEKKAREYVDDLNDKGTFEQIEKCCQ